MTIWFAIFETAIGWPALAWNERGIVRSWLPEPGNAAMRERVLRRLPDAKETEPPPAVAAVIEKVKALFRGEQPDLTGAPLDFSATSDFNARVYEIARTIPPGETMTYGEIAAKLGEKDARKVGQALGENPFAPIVPCHRILGANGKMGGFSAPGGVATKAKLLTIEKARTSHAPLLFDELPLAPLTPSQGR